MHEWLAAHHVLFIGADSTYVFRTDIAHDKLPFACREREVADVCGSRPAENVSGPSPRPRGHRHHGRGAARQRRPHHRIAGPRVGDPNVIREQLASLDDGAVADLIATLSAAGMDVRADEGTRAMYASDASLYRVPPGAVLMPRTTDDIARALEACRERGVSFVARGAGTSVAGNAIGTGLVVDFSRHLNRVLLLDPDAGTAVVQPGVVHRDLQVAALAAGWRFGPDPSTHSRCTVGGMVGNNACGARSLGYGRTSDNLAALQFLTGTGELVTATTDRGHPRVAGGDSLVDGLAAVMSRNLDVARTEFDTFGRQVSGLAVHHLLPERFDLVQALAGSEGTLGVLTEATVKLVREPAVRLLVVLGFGDIAAAAAAAPGVVALRADTVVPTACEGLDSRLVDVLRERRGHAAVPPLPKGRAWLFVELAGESPEEVANAAQRLVGLGLGVSFDIVDDAPRAAALWRIREDGAGLAGRAPSGRPAWAGWEDAAVPPAVLGTYLVEFDRLVEDFGMTSAPFGHFGEGCMHVRLDFPFDKPGGTALFRDFLVQGAQLVGKYGGSLSGEHGDGRARSELLPYMYSRRALALFGAVKHVFDPDNVLNPGVLVDPAPADADLRVPGVPPLRRNLAFTYHDDGGDLSQAVHRCTGVGRCRADNAGTGGVMCPSYVATREERDSTRGRARVLQELVRGERLDWRSEEVAESLDLCLACKGCLSDCPTGIDMATYKAEVLHQRYRHRIRPRAHYTLGWLPRWSRIARLMPARFVNAAMAIPVLRESLLRAAGVDPRRAAPRFAAEPFSRMERRRVRPPAISGAQRVVVFVDSFTNHFRPDAASATIEVIEAAGYVAEVRTDLCCALTWISTGQLRAAKRTLTATVRELAGMVGDGALIVGIEPSCTAVLRHDARDLVPGNDANAVAAATRTLAELIGATPSWAPPDLSALRVVAQPHCHHHAVMGYEADEHLLRRAGANLTTVSGCCGLAGNFGAELGHYEVSVAVAEANLLPALRASPDARILADGFSCHTQVADLAGRDSVHLAQLLRTGTAPIDGRVGPTA